MGSLGGFGILGRMASKLGGSLRRDQRGTTAIEFAMVVGPFLALLFAIMEVSLIYFVEFSIDNGVHKAARLIRTGKVQQGKLSQNAFKHIVCSDIPAFIGCESNVIVDVRSFDTFSQAASDLPHPLTASGSLSGNFTKFVPGGPSKVVVVSLYYDWPLMAKLPGLGDFTGKTGLSLGNMPDGSRLISASTAFRTEAY